MSSKYSLRRLPLTGLIFSLWACQPHQVPPVNLSAGALQAKSSVHLDLKEASASASSVLAISKSRKQLNPPGLEREEPELSSAEKEQKQQILKQPLSQSTPVEAQPTTKPKLSLTTSKASQTINSNGGGGGSGSRSMQVISTPAPTPSPTITPTPTVTATPVSQASASVIPALENTPCSFQVGTNLSEIVDWSTEIPFVDLMKLSRTWISFELDDPNWTWDTGQATELSMRSDGYPTELPQNLPGNTRPTVLRTVWADTQAWPSGTYTVLYDGTGQLSFRGVQNLQNVTSGRLTFTLNSPQAQHLVEMRLLQSDVSDPIHNIRVLMPGTENTYQTQPYYQPWRQEIQKFAVLRFMDWGKTNNWGFGTPWDTQANRDRISWGQRAQRDYYTWTTNKGIPYEIMADTANDLGVDIWLTVPHNASDEYIREMARFFRDRLNPNRTVYLEYSNEIWNWMFGQTKWLNDLGDQSVAWPERTVPFIQNVMDIWTEEYAGQMERLVRTVGVQGASWGISQRFASNLRQGSFDAIAPAAYFHLDTAGYAELARLGENATAGDVIRLTQASQAEGLAQLRALKTNVADALGVPLIFYEGGQHLTPQPFGSTQPYNQALMDAQRHPGMRALYDDWFTGIHQILDGQATVFANFSFVKQRSGRYGSWGMLESMTQDRNVIPAPKYDALMHQINTCGG